MDKNKKCVVVRKSDYECQVVLCKNWDEALMEAVGYCLVESEDYSIEELKPFLNCVSEGKLGEAIDKFYILSLGQCEIFIQRLEENVDYTPLSLANEAKRILKKRENELTEEEYLRGQADDMDGDNFTN